MKILIGDIGNTLTKLCLVSENSIIIKEYNIETAKIIKEKNLIKFLNPILGKKIKKKNSIFECSTKNLSKNK
jgi:pantothenate kinase type III